MKNDCEATRTRTFGCLYIYQMNSVLRLISCRNRINQIHGRCRDGESSSGLARKLKWTRPRLAHFNLINFFHLGTKQVSRF